MVPTSPTRELYVQGSQEHQRPGSNPRTGRLKTDALTTGPRESLTPLRGVVGYESSPEGGALRCEACCACREAPVHVHGVGTGGEGASFRPSAFPGQATKRASLALRCPWGAWPPIPLRFVFTQLLRVRSVRRPGAQAWARLFFAAPMWAGGWSGGAGHTPAPLSGGGGPSPLPRGGCRAAASPLSFRAAACGTPFWLSSCRWRAPLRRARAVGAEVPPRGGGGEGRPVDRSPGGPS